MRIRAFTLAEVLITLTIIGVIAAMVIPALINNATKTETVSQLKKAYSTLSGAYTLIANESDGDFMASIRGSDEYTIVKHFSKYMNVAKDCNTGTGTVPGCWGPAGDGLGALLLNGSSAQGLEYFDVPFITADGMAYDFYLDPSCSDTDGSFTDTCGWGIWVDVNGPNKGKSQIGRDIFLFGLGASEGIYPAGGQNYTQWPSYNDCVKTDRGVTCAYKILKEGAINY